MYSYSWHYHPGGHGVLWFFAIAMALYFLPVLIARLRDAAHTGGLFLVNLFFGWTMIGWLLCLVWALLAETRAQWAWRTFGPAGPYGPQPGFGPPSGFAPPAGYGPPPGAPRWGGRWF